MSLNEGERVVLAVKRNALKRCVTNPIDNALKYGQHAHIALDRGRGAVEIHVDDDGPASPKPDARKRFVRSIVSMKDAICKSAAWDQGLPLRATLPVPMAAIFC